MQDFIPKGTGNSRYLKSNIPANTTLPQLIAMLNAGTFPIDLNGVNSAGINQLGTPLNKNTLLNDDTETDVWGNAANRTVAAALSKLAPKVGDTLTTARTDLDDRWLLCNGEAISPEEYPGLEGMLPPSFTGEWNTSLEVSTLNTSSSHVYAPVSPVFYAGGKVFILLNDTTANYTPTYLYYPADGDITNGVAANWYNKRYGHASHDTTGIAYGNGFWVMTNGGLFYSFSEYGGTATRSSWPDITTTLRDVEFGDGVFAMVGNGKYIYCFETPEPIAGQSRITVSVATSSLYCIKYGGGYWVVAGLSSTLCWATDINGTWTANDITGLGTASYLRYINGYWFVSGGTNLFYTADPTGTWTELAAASGRAFSSIAYTGRYWILNVDGAILYTEDLEGTWISVFGSSLGYPIYGVVAAGDLLVGVTTGTSGGVRYIDINKILLPTISQDKTYTYIKAKEGA